jgi:transketolase C-terminal domain/subunit
MEFIGVHDQFGQSGRTQELIEHYGMGIGSIKDAALKAAARKI